MPHRSEQDAQATPHGRIVRSVAGVDAFVPDPLPPRIRWTDELAVALSAADRAIGRLAAEVRHSSSPRLIVQPLVRREAVLSSRIEGTRTEIDELLLAEAGSGFDAGSDDLREVANYVRALEHGVERLTELPLSLRLVRELHDVLMRGVRGDHAAPGTFRAVQNWIGAPGSPIQHAIYVPPPPEAIPGCLDAWERFLHDESIPPLVHAALVHAQFEAIHPFIDGNGRVGRLLISLDLVARDVLPAPILPLSAAFEATRRDYYGHLLAITQRGAWEAWLHYFLAAVAHQAGDTLARIERVDALVARWRDRLASSPTPTTGRALELFTETPFWTVSRLAERLDVAFATAQRAVDALEKEGVVTQVGTNKRNRVFRSPELLEALTAPSPPFVPPSAGRPNLSRPVSPPAASDTDR